MKYYPRLEKYTARGFVLLAVLTIPACGKGGGQVSGVVTYQGKSVPAGTVLFVGDDNKPVRTPINNDGSYQARNVPLGKVKIAVLVPPPSPPPSAEGSHAPPSAAPAAAIPPKYMDPDTSGLTCDVTGGSQKCPLDLK